MLRYKFSLLLTITLSIIPFFPISSSLAQTSAIPQPSEAPLELDLLTKPKELVNTANTINLSGLSTPSLWWAKDISENKLLDNWIAYPATENESRRVDLIVNQQIWSLLDYLERYNFINRLGSTARRDGYNVRVFNYQKELLGTYTCSFNYSPANCNIQLNTQYKLRRYQ
ncbi:hypothetical protein [Anabaena azotica]|uniref:Uncharacterized protein n=1 Tax=Anabaena azotica FACHB-119 TaxID=947527 RepID=A0ABR8D6I5_9NOST|nr:hypothetical protein [Anabaena azotica]MBD2501935.1 hypothetical protein [Anabaena azotica FACHB-119]